MKRLGLDLGSSSIGWALREGNCFPYKGVITFQSGMLKGQTGGYTSPTADRRKERLKRRLLQSRKYRKWELLKILIGNRGYCPLDEDELQIWSKYKKGRPQKFPESALFQMWLICDFTYLPGGGKYKSPYELRVKALDHKLHPHELGRALYQLVQRRGYKDIGESDKETEKQIQRRGESGFNDALKNHRTIAEALSKAFLEKGKRARNHYPYREEYEIELRKIFQSQGYDISRDQDDEYTDEFVNKVRKAIIWQRDLRPQKGNIGKCTLEPNKPRCPVSHPVFEIFRAWGYINTIKYTDSNGKKQFLPHDFRQQLFEQVFLKADKNFKFEELRKRLDKLFQRQMEYNYPFNSRKGIYDSSVSGMPVCNGLIKIFGTPAKDALMRIESHLISDAPKVVGNTYSIYDLWHALFAFDEKYLAAKLAPKLGVKNEKTKKGEEYNPLASLKKTISTGYADLSLKAMVKIIPFLKEGHLYSEAVLLAKLPEAMPNEWQQKKEAVKEAIKASNKFYEWNKTIVAIANNLIDQYKGLDAPVYAYGDLDYKLDEHDHREIEKACAKYFGETSWETAKDKEDIHNAVAVEYQAFFHDAKRAYRKMPTFSALFSDALAKREITTDVPLYHHSNLDNKYGAAIIDKKTGFKILPEARINSIKNPMFNKALSILRQLLIDLVRSEIIDQDTEIALEVARELNDNNKRAAIELYQNQRRKNREKYREFLREFKENENLSLNVEESIPVFELWTEQTFLETQDEKRQKVTNRSNIDILKEKEAVKRYELWLEQKGQCMYTGKMISLAQLFSNEIDIEHTVPRSLLPDNTLANQTVSYAWYNRDKKRNDRAALCQNFSKDVEGWGTSIEDRLANWIQRRDDYKERYEKELRPIGNEDEVTKNKRIQQKHYLKEHYNYWRDKVDRFYATEIREGWARRQLTDTQTITKYAREFLKTYFKKVAVQKGAVTADFRKIFGFQEEEQIKNRNKHTHHAIDAAVLTLIPTNSSHRERLLKEMYEMAEKQKKQFTKAPYPNFNPQQLIRDIESTTLIVNHTTDNLLKRTFKYVRERGRLQYLKGSDGKPKTNEQGKKIILLADGDTVRSTLFQQSYIGKIRDVERDVNGYPQKNEDGKWRFKTGKDAFLYTVRKPIRDVLSKIDDIVDPRMREHISTQKNNAEILDFQGNPIRHVRVKVGTGQEVKERLNYRSKHDYKNFFYSAAGSIPWAIMVERNADGNQERELVPVSSFKIAKMHKRLGRFDVETFVQENRAELVHWPIKRLLKVGQRVLVLENDQEYEQRFSTDFQLNRLYVITKFSESVWLKYHLEAQAERDIDESVKREKDAILRRYETPLEIPEVVEDARIADVKARKDDYEKRRYSFTQLTSYRFKILTDKIGLERVKQIKRELDKFKTQSAVIEVEGKTPLLKRSKDGWNFLYEGYDFEITALGQIIFKEN